MNQEAQIFNDAQESLHESYMTSTIPTAPPKRPPTIQTIDDDHTSQQNQEMKENTLDSTMNFSNYRFVMSSFELYETKTRYYLIGTNQSKQRYRVLQIHRTNPKELVVIEDDVVYTQHEKSKLLKMIEDGNMSVGGLHLVPMRIYGIVGFVRFTQGWYMIFITRRKQVALLGGHYIYHIDETRLVPVGLQVKIDKNSDEARYITTFQNIDLSKNFYFSYTYDLTNSLQVNMTQPPLHSEKEEPREKTSYDYNDMFVWNHYLLKSGFKDLRSRSGWILPLIYGFFDQAKISVFGRSIVVTLIARRSRYFAGARFLKRGVNDKGFVANDVETEQIVAEMTTTSFHSTDRLYGNPRYTSYVQHRGSIPLIWSQDTTNMSPKPPIELNVVDPFFSAAALHFENLFTRYGTPCIVLNLIKQKEKTKRESILGKEYAEAVAYLNQFLPVDKRIKYIAWDMSRASRSHDQDVIGYLEKIAEETMEATGFFHSGFEPAAKHKPDRGELPPRRAYTRQHGVLRTNCIDCLDRTNAAQFLMGKCALGHQLYALGVIGSPKIDFDSDVVNIFTEMYHDHGDTIALQYGGSHLVNTMETYRKINQWTSHPRDMIESIKRFYANAFSDADKQDAINLFLGNYVTKDGQPMLWELNSDYHLHNQDPRLKTVHHDYRKWFSEKALHSQDHEMDPALFTIPPSFRAPAINPDESDPFHGYWEEYYMHHQLTSLDNLFFFNMNGTLKYRPPKPVSSSKDNEAPLTKAEALEISPFTVRSSNGRHGNSLAAKPELEKEIEEDTKSRGKEKSGSWTMDMMVKRSLEPSVTHAEHKEYRRYVQQFRQVEKYAVPMNDQASPAFRESFPEYKQYQNYVHRNALDENPLALRIQGIDEQVYTAYVNIPRRAASVQISRERSDNTRKRYEGYDTYVRSGRYPPHTQRNSSNMPQNVVKDN
ncbi:SacI homology domain-containing protein [Phycomyces nitens]|nr:SacI homology domain-containing protein [Phycomyces nitens]